MVDLGNTAWQHSRWRKSLPDQTQEKQMLPPSILFPKSNKGKNCFASTFPEKSEIEGRLDHDIKAANFAEKWTKKQFI